MENQEQLNQGQPQTINIQVPSADNIASRRSLIPASFAFAIICFFFTFCDLKCVSNGQKLASVTGIELVTGTQLKDHDMMSGKEKKGENIPSNIWAILAFGAAVIGLGVFIIKEKREALIGTGAGVIGFGSLLILQFVLKNAMEKKGEGQLEADFQFAYWASVLAMGIAGLISYWRMKQSHNIVISHSPPQQQAVDKLSPESTITQHQESVISSSNSDASFDTAEWFGKNKKMAIGIFFLITVSFGVYQFFLKHDPESDGRKAAIAFLGCDVKQREGFIKVYAEFVKSFSSYNFKNSEEARKKLNELVSQNAEIKKWQECMNTESEKNKTLRNRYLTNEVELKKFKFAAEAEGQLIQDKLNKLDLEVKRMRSEVENEIATLLPEIPLQSQ